MKSVGEILRQARLEQGWDVADVAGRLKINPKYLTSIEENALSELPGLFFYRSFVQQYARALNLECTEIDAELERALGTQPPPPLPGQDGLPVAVRKAPYGMYSSRRVRSLGWSMGALAIVLASCSGIYALWNNLAQVRSVAASVVSRVTDKASETRVRKPVTVAVNSAPNPAQESLAGGGILLRLTATEATWVSVEADGKIVFSGILQPSESRTIDGKFAKLITGNAGGLSVEFHGKSIGAVGDRGQVRVVVFSPDRFEFAQAQAPPRASRPL